MKNSQLGPEAWTAQQLGRPENGRPYEVIFIVSGRHV
jgi:hypothetical protein